MLHALPRSKRYPHAREPTLPTPEPARLSRTPSKPRFRSRPKSSGRVAVGHLAARLPWKRALILSLEVAALAVSALIVVMAALGRSAERLAGTGLFSSLLPFAAVVLALALVITVLLKSWLGFRTWLASLKPFLPAMGATLIATWAAWFASQESFDRELRNFRTLVGGTEEAERQTIAHQVFASYRRTDLAQFQRMLIRAQIFLPAINEAAEAYDVDADVLVGVAAAESSFLPRDSKDGGRGLFQITAPPKSATELARKDLEIKRLDLTDTRHNAFVAAATLSHYLTEMSDDLFLGLLAYNIGPKNGGLLSIMNQYGARDFVTIQPYLQHLPRDYPIRVLTAALAYRLWRTEGKLPRYEEGRNAAHIQSIGIPGLPEAREGAPVKRLAERDSAS